MTPLELIERWSDLAKRDELYVVNGHFRGAPTELEVEIEKLESECRTRWKCWPWELYDRGVIPSSWTDADGVTHDGGIKHRCTAARRMDTLPERDEALKPLTCIECAARTP